MHQKHDAYMNLLIYVYIYTYILHIYIYIYIYKYYIWMYTLKNEKWSVRMKNWIYYLFISLIGIIQRFLNTFQISVSQYSICTCSILLSFLLTFYFQANHLLLPFSKSKFKFVQLFSGIFLLITPWFSYLHYHADINASAWFKKLTLAINYLLLHLDAWMR